MTSRTISASASLSLLCALALSGCGVGLKDTTSSTVNAAFKGHIMGGQQPVAHASVQFFAAGAAGYGQSAAPVSPIVPTDTNGVFSLSTPFKCPSDKAQIFVVATGGNPGLDESKGTIDNSAIALVAALGDCDTLNADTTIQINEVTTVAAAWALAPFATDYNQISTSPGNTVGLANAFGMAANLVSYVRGTSPGDAPANAKVPSDEVNLMANILASCVNTKGYSVSDGSPCDILFGFATPPKGTAPTNTFTAALDIAQHPGNNAAAIAILPTPQAPFQTTTGYVAPTDWTMAITFPIGPTVANNIAIDSKGDVWTTAPDGLYELSPTGVQQPSYPSLAGNTVAFDPSGNIWVALSNSAQIAKMPASLGTPTLYSADVNGVGVGGLAIDGSGDIWYTCGGCTTINALNPDGSAKAISPAITGHIFTNLSIDPSENVWAGNFGSEFFYVVKPDASFYPDDPYDCTNCGIPSFVTNDGSGQAWIVDSNVSLISTLGGDPKNILQPTGGLLNPVAIAIDGSGHAWVADHNGVTLTSGGISEFDSTGSPISPDTGYTSPDLSTPGGIAVDGSGNVWVENTGSATVTAFVGAATPVVTPFSVGLANSSLGSKP